MSAGAGGVPDAAKSASTLMLVLDGHLRHPPMPDIAMTKRKISRGRRNLPELPLKSTLCPCRRHIPDKTTSAAYVGPLPRCT
jgi:hypothetical protein